MFWCYVMQWLNMNPNKQLASTAFSTGIVNTNATCCLVTYSRPKLVPFFSHHNINQSWNKTQKTSQSQIPGTPRQHPSAQHQSLVHTELRSLFPHSRCKDRRKRGQHRRDIHHGRRTQLSLQEKLQSQNARHASRLFL